MNLAEGQLPRNTCSWKLAGTETFRLASSMLSIGQDNYGTNLQNVKKSLTKIYIPDEGKVLVNVDQSGAEALVVAHETEHGNFRELFKNGIKSHVYVALHVFADIWEQMHPDAEVPKLLTLSPTNLRKNEGFGLVEKSIKQSDNNPPAQRYYHIAKMACHALNYGMKPRTFQTNTLQKSEGEIALTFKEAERIYYVYHELFPEIKRWHARVIAELQSGRVLRNLFNYPRKFTQRWSDDLVRQALAYTPQSTVGTITNLVYVQMQDYIERESRDWDMLNNKHDSVLAQVPIGEQLEAATQIQEFMDMDLVSATGVAFKMASGAEWGFNWYPFNEETNPEGMREV